MSDDNTKVTDLSTEQQKAVIDTKAVLASKQDVLMAIGQVQAFNNMRKYATVAELVTYRKIKDSKQYKGLVYEDESGKSATVADIKEVCTIFFGRSYRSMQEDEQNLTTFGEEFFESSKNMGLGNRELRKLRQLPTETQELIINSEKVDLNDKEAVKELIEDEAFKHATELKQANKRGDDLKTNLHVAREMSAEKDQELNSLKEQEAKRQMSQEPWHRNALDSVNAMIEARASITQGSNQLLDVLNNLSKNHELDSKAIDLIGRSLLSEAQHNLAVISDMCNDAFSILGDKYHPDLTVDDLFNQLHSNDTSKEEINAE